jgi:hypothetical protein
MLNNEWRRICMQQDQQAKENLGSVSSGKAGFSGTDPQKVKQEIQKDVSAGQGAMTSREAGAMRD